MWVASCSRECTGAFIPILARDDADCATHRAGDLHLLLPFARTRSSLTLTHALADADQKLPVDSASVSSYPDGDRESAGPKDEDGDGEVEYPSEVIPRRMCGSNKGVRDL